MKTLRENQQDIEDKVVRAEKVWPPPPKHPSPSYKLPTKPFLVGASADFFMGFAIGVFSQVLPVALVLVGLEKLHPYCHTWHQPVAAVVLLISWGAAFLLGAVAIWRLRQRSIFCQMFALGGSAMSILLVSQMGSLLSALK